MPDRLKVTLPPLELLSSRQLNGPTPGGWKETVSEICWPALRLKDAGFTLNPLQFAAAVPERVPPPPLRME